MDLVTEPLGNDTMGKPVFLKDIWPTRHEVAQAVEKCVRSEMFQSVYAGVYEGDEQWRSLAGPEGEQFAWGPKAAYVKHTPYFGKIGKEPAPIPHIKGARVLGRLGDTISTEHN